MKTEKLIKKLEKKLNKELNELKYVDIYWCTCGNKNPDLDYHYHQCKYYILSNKKEIIEKSIASLALIDHQLNICN